jgi:dTDP-4-dehydrorhamnose 3,5-epimerase
LRWNDPAVRIEWPLQPREMSDKDLKWPDLNSEFHGVEAMRGFCEVAAGPPVGDCA